MTTEHQHKWVIRPYDLEMVGPQLPNRLHVNCYGCEKSRYYEIDHLASVNNDPTLSSPTNTARTEE